jgi:hypothetical protein
MWNVAFRVRVEAVRDPFRVRYHDAAGRDCRRSCKTA